MTVAEPFDRLVQRIAPGATPLRSWTLEGGVSAYVDALEFIRPNGTQDRVVVRRPQVHPWTSPAYLDRASMEFNLLKALRKAHIAVPEPHLLDTSGELLSAPYFVMGYVEGTTVVLPEALPDALKQMAHTLAQIHALDVTKMALPQLPYRNDPVTETLTYLPQTTAYQKLRAVLSNHHPWPSQQHRRASLLHGDFWPGNLLWNAGELIAVIDWEDAALGDPLSDLACCRVELLWRHGPAVVDAFTTHYRTQTQRDLTILPFWDVYVAAAAMATMGQWGLAPDVEAHMRCQATLFIERASAQVLSMGSPEG
ncbi:MAG: phosphotransferase family protein [Myxococcota bacterium]